MQLNRFIHAGIASALVLTLSGIADAQSSAHRESISPMKPNPYLQHQDPWRWDVHTQAFFRAGRVVVSTTGRRTDRGRTAAFEELTTSWSLKNFEFIYPVVHQGGHYWSPNTDVKLSLRVDDIEFEPQPTRLQTPDSHSPYIWWKVRYEQNKTHQIHFRQVSYVVCADTKFDEKLAAQIPWPDEWPEEAERFLSPVVDQIQEPIDVHAQDQLAMMVDQWMEGNNPRSIDEVTLAKYLTAKVIEHVQVGFSRSANAPFYRPLNYSQVEDGFSTFPTDSWAGYRVRSADQVAIDPRGSALDLSTMLVAVFRTAGIPARLLVCYDKSDSIDPLDRVKGLVEFAMYDRERDQILWIPVDPERLRDHGRRTNTYTQRWEYFGSHDQLRNLVPLAYYFHPPVNYKAFGYPGLYGLRTEPDIGNRVSPILSLDIMNSPMRAEDLIKEHHP